MQGSSAEPIRREPVGPAARDPLAASLARALRCVECGHESRLEVETSCPACLGPLAVSYDLAPLRGGAPGDRLSGRRPSIARFAELLPPISPPWSALLDLETTPLRSAPRLAEWLGLESVWLKDDTVLPTGSFKDRPASVAVAFAAARDYSAVGCASTGNLAAATTRAAVRASLPCFVFVPAGLPDSKLDPVRQLGGQIVEVDGPYDTANRVANLAAEAAGIGVVNITLRPYYTEGSKTLAFEALESLGWDPPDVIALPLGSGALLAATDRAISQLREIGWIPPGRGPALVGSQPDGCAPIADAFDGGSDEIIPVQHPHTIAESLAIGDPGSGYEALRAIRASHGAADSPTSEEVVAAIRALARTEGIWVEPAGGTVIATLRRLRESGTIRRSDRVVAFLTGAGWKIPHAVPPLSSPTIRLDAVHPDLSRLQVSGRPTIRGGAE
jgi:threonine synthase